MLVLYSLIFIIGVFGNVLVLYVVISHKSMQTITNNFIACLSASDLLICLFAIPFTPIQALTKSWMFGKAMCKLVPVILVISVFVSTLTSVVIAIDRYLVIVYPHAKRMSGKMQLLIIGFIWILASTAAVPIGVFTKHQESGGEPVRYACNESWPTTKAASMYGWSIFVLRLVIPSAIITVCYTTISIRLNRRMKKKFCNNMDVQKEKQDVQRNRRINRMLIAMIVTFIVCWLPIDLIFTTAELNLIPEENFLMIFLFMHILAMSSVIYNPFLYGWMNENFNCHFRKIWRKFLAFCCKCKTRTLTSHQERNNQRNRNRMSAKLPPSPSSPSTSMIELKNMAVEKQHAEPHHFLLPIEENTRAGRDVSQHLLQRSLSPEYTS
ncbi:PRLHR [Bugula neritina]|uniref:PRLHR n=1 Tax=Bugula neritina TaxID=10212 RepID=A0A7J7JFJ3_BUGNE|nr:PRLHR [Bugula neritina]